MGGLKPLFTSADIDSVVTWGKDHHKDESIIVTKPVDGLRFFEGTRNEKKIQYEELIYQENRRYTVYG